MSSIKIYLEADECTAVQRYAEALGVSEEDIAYAALKQLMRDLKTKEDEISREVIHLRLSRRQSQSPWGTISSAIPFHEREDGSRLESGPWREH